MLFRRLLYGFLFVSLTACGVDGEAGWSERNLMQYNVPISIMAPDSAKVRSKNVSGVMQDVTVTEEDENFALQIFTSQAYTQDVARIKGDQIELVRANPYFSSILTEEPDGFLYENRIDSVSTFGFRYVLFKGSQEIVVQNAMGRIFTEAEARKMYDAVKQR